MKHKSQRGIFEEENRFSKLTKQQDPLVRLRLMIDWEQFREALTLALKKEAKGAGGRPPFDYVMMFKILILQRYYNLSDDQTEFQILDRLSFMRFLGLTLNDRVPDSKTIWSFREQLTEANVTENLFSVFITRLTSAGLVLHEGSIVDASFVEVPKQRNSRKENEQIKAGQIPEGWQEKPNKLSQKDIDARWTKKNNVAYYGYKDHVKVDSGSKLVITYCVTDASVHDSQEILGLLTDKDKNKSLHADSAYSGAGIAAELSGREIQNQIHEKGYKKRPLTEQQIERNKIKSKVRARVEHVFGFVENSMNGSFIRSIGKKRATAIIGLINLTYNVFRALQLITKGKQGISVSI